MGGQSAWVWRVWVGGKVGSVIPLYSLFSCLRFGHISWWDSHSYGGKRKYFAISIIFESLYSGELYRYFLRDGMDVQVFYEHIDFGLLDFLKCFMVGRLKIFIFRERKSLYYFTKAFNCTTTKQNNFEHYSIRSLSESEIRLYLKSFA